MIHGIILAGGKSKRFGSCKTNLMLGKENLLQKNFNLLERHCSSVAVSTRQGKNIENYPCIFDKLECDAPINGIYSALKFFKAPVLVLPCDAPFINDELLSLLIAQRNKAKQENKELLMTTFQKKGTELVEALIAIYEYESLNFLESAIEEKRYSLFRVIEKERRHQIILDNETPLFNINYPQDLETAQKIAHYKV